MAELRGLPRRAAVLRASEVLFQVGLEEERSRLIRTFSTGMKQRTKLAQAIVHAPELVVLDEPTNGLDPAGREEMLPPRAPAVERPRHRACCSARTCSRTSRAPATRSSCCATATLVTAGRIDELARRSRARACCARLRRPRRVPPPCWATRGLTAERRDGGVAVHGAGEDACSTPCATPPPTPGSGCASCAPAGPHPRGRPRGRAGVSDRRRDPRCALPRATRASGAAAWPASRRWRAGAPCARSAPAAAGRPSRPDRAHAARLRPGAHRARRARAVRRPERHRPERRAAVLATTRRSSASRSCSSRPSRRPSCSAPTGATACSTLYFSTAVSRCEYLAGHVLAAMVPLLL